jgi:hypothetical protein
MDQGRLEPLRIPLERRKSTARYLNILMTIDFAAQELEFMPLGAVGSEALPDRGELDRRQRTRSRRRA